MLDLARLRELTIYTPETGEFVWRRSKGAAKAGSPVGGKHRSKGYGEACIDGQYHQTHRLVWFYVHGCWPTGQIDHINGKRDDNRLSNLRDVSAHGNQQNRTRGNKGKKYSDLIGAYWGSGSWFSTILVGGKHVYLGRFPSAEAAHAAYIEAKRKHHSGCTI